MEEKPDAKPTHTLEGKSPPRQRPGEPGPCCGPGRGPYPGDGQSRGLMRGRSLASSSVDLGRGVNSPEATDSSMSADPDVVVGTDSTRSTASSVMTSAGISSPNCSTLGVGLTICQRKNGKQPAWRLQAVLDAVRKCVRRAAFGRTRILSTHVNWGGQKSRKRKASLVSSEKSHAPCA